MMNVIPLTDSPSQDFNVNVGGQFCSLSLRTRLDGAMYMDVYVNNALIVGGVVCQNLNRIVRNAYLGFIGDLLFIDNQGASDPSYPGLGTRYELLYLSVDDLTANGL